jgi:hypothetical protein
MAQAVLGRMYLNGEDVPRDVAKAEKWLLAAARQGQPEAQADLAHYRAQRSSACIELPGAIGSVFVSGTRAYLASGLGGLQILDISRLGMPRLLSKTHVESYAKGVTVAGRHAFVTAGPAGYPLALLHAFDVSDPRAPRHVGSIELADYPESVFVRDTLVFVADRTEGLRIISVSRPESLTQRGFVNTPGTAVDVLLADRYAFVADSDSGVRIIDISAADSPREVASLRTPGTALGLCLSEHRLFVATGQPGVVVADVANPRSPTVLDTIVTLGPALWVSIDGHNAFVAEGPAGVEIFDVGSGAPRKVGLLKAVFARAAFGRGERAWIADITPLHGYLDEGPSTLCEETWRPELKR